MEEAVGSKIDEDPDDGATEKEKMSPGADAEEEVDGGPKREPGLKEEEEEEEDEDGEGREGEGDADLFTKALPLDAISWPRCESSDWSRAALGLVSGVRLPGTSLKMDTDEASRNSGGLNPPRAEADDDVDDDDDEEVEDNGGPKIDPKPASAGLAESLVGVVDEGPNSEPGLKDTDGADDDDADADDAGERNE